MDPETFIVQRLKAALTRQGAAVLLRVSERTVRNWEKGRTVIPYSAYRLLCIEAGYELPGAAWRGFVLRGDTIWSPEGKSFTAHDLGWWQLTCELARDRLQRALQLAAAPSQPVADAPRVLLRAADRRAASTAPGRTAGPSLQNRGLPADLGSGPGMTPLPAPALPATTTARHEPH